MDNSLYLYITFLKQALHSVLLTIHGTDVDQLVQWVSLLLGTRKPEFNPNTADDTLIWLVYWSWVFEDPVKTFRAAGRDVKRFICQVIRCFPLCLYCRYMIWSLCHVCTAGYIWTWRSLHTSEQRWRRHRAGFTRFRVTSDRRQGEIPVNPRSVVFVNHTWLFQFFKSDSFCETLRRLKV